jgi:hypothetical protein
MALIGIVNLADILLNPTATASKEILAATPGPATVNNATTAATGDQFTVAGQNTAQAAGLFTVNQFAVFSAAAEAILAGAPAQASPATTTAATANVTTPAATQTAVATAATQVGAAATATATPIATPAPANAAATKAAAAARALAVAAPIATPAAANTPAAKAVAAAQALAAAAPIVAASIDDKVQALNSALAALGVDRADVRKIDSIAVLINDSNPVAFASLVQQIEGLSQKVAPQVPATLGTAEGANNAGGVANATNTNGGGFHIQELLVRFASAGAPATAGVTNNAAGGTGAAVAAGGNAGPSPASVAALQAEVQLSLADDSGHTIHVRAPADAVTANPPANGNQAPAQTRVAKA